jgi:uncharacterized protein YjgD (DUF1641 family)
MSPSAQDSNSPAGSGNQQALLERIDARLERIDARLAQLDARLAKLDPLLDAAPGLLALAGDSFDEFARELGDLDERLRGLLAVLERASRPETLAKLEAAVDLLDSVPGLVALAGDSFDDFARNAAARGLELDRIVPELGRAIEAVLRLLTNAQIRGVLSSDLLMPGTVEALATAARAMAAATQAPQTRLGLFATFAALREPEVQRAVGFAVDVARRFGSHIDQLELPPGEPSP